MVISCLNHINLKNQKIKIKSVQVQCDSDKVQKRILKYSIKSMGKFTDQNTIINKYVVYERVQIINSASFLHDHLN